EHLGVPVVGAERPAVVEDDGLGVFGAPVFEVDPDAVAGGDGGHGGVSEKWGLSPAERPGLREARSSAYDGRGAWGAGCMPRRCLGDPGGAHGVGRGGALEIRWFGAPIAGSVAEPGGGGGVGEDEGGSATAPGEEEGRS